MHKSISRMIKLMLLLSILTIIFAGCGSKKSEYKEIQVSIMTDKGEIVVSLRPDLMPITVNNFVGLVEKGFYNGLKFHRVEDWVIQGGDPLGNGRGGSDKNVKLETSTELKNVKYAIAMARSSDPNSASSQFYIIRKKDQPSLDGKYAVFGNVIKGKEVVDKIELNDKMTEIKVLEKIKK